MSTDEGENEKSGTKIPQNDKISILLLFFLYMLQGIPLGLIYSTTLLLQNKNATYKELALFSLSDWPFSIKLLWAPIVDSLYWKQFGRWKSWLIPSQCLLGFSMLLLSAFISSMLGNSDSSPDIHSLTGIFLAINFLTATQDIAVDGWALTILSRENVGYASICNCAGQRVGYFLGNVVFLVLESPEFCNLYLRSVPQPYGLITFPGFLKFSGIIFIVATLVILIFKSEKEDEFAPKIPTIKETFCQLYHILHLKNILLLIVVLQTFQIALAATDAVTNLKLIEAGVPKETVSLLQIPTLLVEVFLPFYVGSFLVELKTLNLFLKAFPYKLIFCLLLVILVWWTRYVKLKFGFFPSYYYVIIALSFMLHQAIHLCIYLSITSFFNKVSDPSIGGTYMTLLNTCYNLGYCWTSTVALWFVDILTFKKCDNPLYSCTSAQSASKCVNEGHSCLTVYDGYIIETVACVIFGVVWLKWGRSVVCTLQASSPSEWKTKC